MVGHLHQRIHAVTGCFAGAHKTLFRNFFVRRNLKSWHAIKDEMTWRKESSGGFQAKTHRATAHDCIGKSTDLVDAANEGVVLCALWH